MTPSDPDAQPGGNRIAWRAAIVALLMLVGILHFETSRESVHWLYVEQRLYYLPIVLLALADGWRGGSVAALLAGCLFAAGTPAVWTVPAVNVFDQILEIVMFFVVGIITGGLTDRRRSHERSLRNTTIRLREVNRELQENFERMKRAERLSALGQLSAGFAHEIRNPLASIEGAAVVVQRETRSAERRREFLEIIQKECRRLNRLLSSFLEFAKPRQPDLRVVGMDTLLDSVIELLQNAGGNAPIQLRKEIQPDMVKVECDPEQIKQVLLNLAMNAIQAMPGGGTVMLAAGQNGAQFTIDVHDQGPGIGAANLDQIFDPFFTTRETGTGLGLSVAHQIVTQHGGSLAVLRNSARGTTFRISLPVRRGI